MCGVLNAQASNLVKPAAQTHRAPHSHLPGKRGPHPAPASLPGGNAAGAARTAIIATRSGGQASQRRKTRGAQQAAGGAGRAQTQAHCVIASTGCTNPWAAGRTAPAPSPTADPRHPPASEKATVVLLELTREAMWRGEPGDLGGGPPLAAAGPRAPPAVRGAGPAGAAARPPPGMVGATMGPAGGAEAGYQGGSASDLGGWPCLMPTWQTLAGAPVHLGRLLHAGGGPRAHEAALGG